MKIIYRSTVCDFEDYCALGRRYQLYAKWGSMQYWYQEPDLITTMAIAYRGKIPVGMAVLRDKGQTYSGVRFGVFVRQYMRRQGVGSRLVSLVRKRAGQNFMVAKYDDQQTEFFDALGIKGYREYVPDR